MSDQQHVDMDATSEKLGPLLSQRNLAVDSARMKEMNRVHFGGWPRKMGVGHALAITDLKHTIYRKRIDGEINPW